MKISACFSASTDFPDGADRSKQQLYYCAENKNDFKLLNKVNNWFKLSRRLKVTKNSWRSMLLGFLPNFSISFLSFLTVSLLLVPCCVRVNKQTQLLRFLSLPFFFTVWARLSPRVWPASYSKAHLKPFNCHSAVQQQGGDNHPPWRSLVWPTGALTPALSTGCGDDRLGGDPRGGDTADCVCCV